MTATLTFNLPEEAHEHQAALDGWKWKALVSHLADTWGSTLKHDDSLPLQAALWLEKAREQLFRDLEDRGLSLYE